MRADPMTNQMAYLKIIYTSSATACASNHSYRLSLRRCSNNSRLVASSNLETLHRSFTTFTIRIVLKISTNDRVDCRRSYTGLYICKPGIGRYVDSTEDPIDLRLTSIDHMQDLWLHEWCRQSRSNSDSSRARAPVNERTQRLQTICRSQSSRSAA